MAKKKQVLLSPVQLAHLVNCTIKNLMEFQFSQGEDGNSLRFILMLDCLFPDDCVPIDEEPEGEEEVLDIMWAHGVISLAPFFETSFRVKNDEGEAYRSFNTIPVGPNNMAEFIECLSEIDSFWAELDSQVEEEQDMKDKTKGKNFVEGNGTVN